MKKTYHIPTNKVAEFKWLIASLKGVTITYEYHGKDSAKFIIFMSDKESMVAVYEYINTMNEPNKTNLELYGIIAGIFIFSIILLFITHHK